MTDLSQLNVNNTDYNLKDAAARNDIRSTQVVTGNPITLTDSSETYAESLVVEFSPKQDLHGQSAPYVGGAGKNKLPMTVEGIKDVNTDGTWSGNTYTISGVTFTILTDDGGNVTGINADGTASTDILFYEATYLARGNIIYNGCPSGGSWASYCQVLIPSYAADYGDGASYNFTEESSQVAWIRIASGTSVSNKVFHPMARLATETDPTFAPYSNICPITGYTECEVDDVGKNLFYYNKIDGENAQSNKIPYVSGLKIKHFGSTAISGGSLVARFYDEFDNAIGSDILTYTIDAGGQWNVNAPSGTDYVVFTSYRSSGNGGIDAYIDAEIMCATDVSTYEPYHSSNATIQFGQTVYGGRSNFTDGGTDDEFESVDLGTLYWFKIESGGVIYFQTDSLMGVAKPPINDSTAANCLSSVFRFVAWNSGVVASCVAAIAGVGDVVEGRLSCQIHEYDNMTETEFKTAMSGVQLLYEKATPTTIATPPTDLKLLQGTNNITTNGTTINLGYQPDNVIGDVKGEIEKITVMPYLRILDNDVDTEIKNYRLYYRLISSSYTLVNLAEMLQHRFLFVEIIQNPSGTANHTLLHSALIDPRTIDGFEYQMKAGTGDTVIIESNIAENKFDLSVRYTGTHTSGDPTDYYVTIRMVD